MNRSGVQKIELIQNYQKHIDRTREEFECALQQPRIKIDDILRFSDHINTRLKYYGQIKEFRRSLRHKLRDSMVMKTKRNLDINLKVAGLGQIRQYDFGDRSSDDALYVITKLKNELNQILQ